MRWRVGADETREEWRAESKAGEGGQVEGTGRPRRCQGETEGETGEETGDDAKLRFRQSSISMREGG